MNKKKIINDPVYGFIHLPYELIFDLLEHPYFQRLRRIKQLGLTCYVYPGATHSRFHHALGAMHLMTQAVAVLQAKRVAIEPAEAEAVCTAILLHDIGHGPFSHALEHTIVAVHHETLSMLFMEQLNRYCKGRLSLAMSIFEGDYPKAFLHELVSSQLDMDRMDYLNRDSFFTGVEEGVIGFERIIKMLDVYNNHIVVEAKGIYSVEQFLIARRLMYWQVYLHKTALAAECMLVKLLERAKYLTQQGHTLEATPAFSLFLQNHFTEQDFQNNPDLLAQFALLDDTDIEVAMKVWQNHSDRVLSILAKGLLNRQILKIVLENEPISEELYEQQHQRICRTYQLSKEEADYLVFCGTTSNSAYSYKGSQINIAYKNGAIKNITQASDYLNLAALAATVVKHYLCYLK
ncbi:MAG: HD domain-containing protein [Chitinophagales bacterium]|jgi:HD superfamily phosphohydrolase|nr:HD domain-containing protein [Chitinophagales bacterium]